MTRTTIILCPIGLLLGTLLLAAQQPPPPPPTPIADGQAGVEELAAGPIHEAFGRPLVYNPQPGPVVAKVPPAPVEEVPPGEKPAGEAVAWIPRYWAWDDEAKDFLWVSGLWRELPPGRTWLPGYWAKVADGYRWVSGYWVEAGGAETEYLADAPPESLEAGPVGNPPAVDQVWVPGA